MRIKAINQTLIIIGIGFFLIQSNVFSLNGADYTEVTVNGKTYNVPIPNKGTREDLRYVKMALAGDKIAREMLLGGEEKKYFFIGDVNVVRWLILEKNKESIIEHETQT